eukprot:Pgem_evm1s15717
MYYNYINNDEHIVYSNADDKNIIRKVPVTVYNDINLNTDSVTSIDTYSADEEDDLGSSSSGIVKVSGDGYYYNEVLHNDTECDDFIKSYVANAEKPIENKTSYYNNDSESNTFIKSYINALKANANNNNNDKHSYYYNNNNNNN